MGRCIRHRLDYGAIIFLDSRFRPKMSAVDKLTKWVQPFIKFYHKPKHMIPLLKKY